MSEMTWTYVSPTFSMCGDEKFAAAAQKQRMVEDRHRIAKLAADLPYDRKAALSFLADIAAFHALIIDGVFENNAD